MPRPCVLDHSPRPRACRVCQLCADPSEVGLFHRQLWDEPEPDGLFAIPPAPQARDLLPNVPDPIPDPELKPLPWNWARLPSVIERHRAAFIRVAQAPLVPPPRKGRGVLLLGGGKFWPGNVLAVKMLRDTGCTLPIQIWHRGDEEPVWPDNLAGFSDVEIRNLKDIRPAPRRLLGWESKTVAMLASGWERIFFHDADAYCVADPAPVLDRLSPAEPFLFWEDLPGTQWAVNWSTWGLEGSAIPPIQGGQIAIHLPHFWREFVLSYWLNQHSDFSYSHQYGDQDAWRVALTVTGGRYSCIGPAVWDDVAFICSAGDSPLVVHRCQAKMFYPEDVIPGDHMSNRRLDRLPGEAKAWAHWNELLEKRSAAETFGRIYSSGLWGADETSGDGSTPAQAKPYLDIVNGLIRTSGWGRVIDLGSGDGYVASRLEASEVVGVECHARHVERLRTSDPGRQWLNLDLNLDREQLPVGDVALLKDVLHHWPNRLVREWLSWARACGKWQWLVCTQDRHQLIDNQDCPLGGYRGLDLTMEPLRGLGLVPFCEYLHKGVLLLKIGT